MNEVERPEGSAAEREYMRMFGNRVREYRKQRDMTQLELGAKVGRGLSMVSAIENGTRKVYVGELYTWAEALDVPASVLLGYEDADRYEAGWRAGWEAFADRVGKMIRREGSLSAGLFPGAPPE